MRCIFNSSDSVVIVWTPPCAGSDRLDLLQNCEYFCSCSFFFLLNLAFKSLDTICRPHPPNLSRGWWVSNRGCSPSSSLSMEMEETPRLLLGDFPGECNVRGGSQIFFFLVGSIEFLFAHVYILYRMNKVGVYLWHGFSFEELEHVWHVKLLWLIHFDFWPLQFSLCSGLDHGGDVVYLTGQYCWCARDNCTLFIELLAICQRSLCSICQLQQPGSWLLAKVFSRLETLNT